jgi:uncharacterized protein (TIGR00159 family)
MGFIKFRVIDGIDIAAVALIIYYFLSFIKGTKAIQITIGLVSVLILGIFAEFFKLGALSFISKGFGAAWIILFVVLFQPELRNAFARLGKTRVGKFFTKERNVVIDELVRIAIALSERRQGGIITVERDISCKNYIESGHRIEGKLSAELIMSIFNPKSSLHDGAIIVKGDTILASSCILPLSDRTLDSGIGTRHRAALGLAEETDAVSIVISEETGNISLAVDRMLMRNLSKERLEKELKEKLG